MIVTHVQSDRHGRSRSLLRVSGGVLAIVLLFVAPLLAQGDGAGDPGEPVPAAAEEELVQVSLSGASIDAVTEWLAEMTRKSIIKHKDVDCSLNVLSSRKIPKANAVSLVYGALALEGYIAIERRDVIIIVPEKLESKVGTELFTGDDELAEGRQVVLRLFTLKFAKPSKLKDTFKPVLSEKAKIEVDDRASKIIITDYADNVRLVEKMIDELDVETATDRVTEVFILRHMKAEDLARILGSIFDEASPTPAAKPRRPNQKNAKATTASGDNLIVLPDAASNRIVVTAPAERMGDVRSLIRTLDTEKPADVAVRVIPLVHVDAEELTRELGAMYRKIRGSSLKDTIEISANDRSNSLIVLSSETNYESIKELVRTLDTKDAQKRVTRTFSLEYADADEIATQLEELFQVDRWNWRRGGNDDTETRFVSNRRANEVIAIGNPNSLEQVDEMIRILDQPVSEEYLAPKIYPLKYVAAEDIKAVLDELFTKQESTRDYWSWEPSEDTNDIGRLYGKVRFATEPYSNSIIVTTNSQENFDVVKGILDQLDTRSPDREATLSIQLKYAKAVHVSNYINILFARTGAPPFNPNRNRAPNRNPNNNRNNNNDSTSSSEGFEIDEDDDTIAFYPWLGGAGGNSGGNNRRRGDQGATRDVSDLVGKVRIVPDPRTNALLVTTAPHFFPEVRRVVSSMDIPTPQVLIEAKILEVARDDRDRLGVRWSPQGDQVFDSDDFDDSLLASGNAMNRETYVGSLLDTALRTGSVSANIDLDVLVQFLRRNTESRVRAEPRLNVADNERGKLFVGSRIPFISNTLNTSEGGQNSTFEYQDVGITLEVTPNINANGEVALKIRVEASQIRPGETLFGGAIVDTRNYKTELTVQDGESLILGGIIQQEESEVVRKVPILGDIPILGFLFKKRDTVRRDVELMVFLRPTVTRSPEEVSDMMRRERAKTPHIQMWEDEQAEEAEELRRERERKRR